MKSFIGILFFVIICSGFVFAVSSEADVSFGFNTPATPTADYVYPESSIGDYFGYFVTVFIALALVYFIVKRKSSGKKKVARSKKASSKKAKKVSKKKVKKK